MSMSAVHTLHVIVDSVANAFSQSELAWVSRGIDCNVWGGAGSPEAAQGTPLPPGSSHHGG